MLSEHGPLIFKELCNQETTCQLLGVSLFVVGRRLPFEEMCTEVRYNKT